MARPLRSALDPEPRRIDARPDFRPRGRCYRCMRPTATCWCALLPQIVSPTRLLVLQHPREELVAIGTARMAALCLEGADLVVGTELDEHPAVRAALSDPERSAVLLWPGPGAVDLALAPPRGPTTLVVVDGTWSLAKKLVRLNPRIAALPRYALSPDRPSEYRIRAEPRPECISTIEAVIQALGAIDGDRERYEPMMRPFRAMIDRQIDCEATERSHRARAHKRPPRARIVAPRLRQAESVVVVVGEASAYAYDADPKPPDELVHWLAVRLVRRRDADEIADERADVFVAERFEELARPEGALAPTCARHIRVEAERILEARGLGELTARWRDFVRPGDVFASWSPYAPELFRASGGALEGGVVDLRAAATTWLRDRTGSVADCVTRLGLDAPALGMGRGGERLGMAAAVARFLMGQAEAPAPGASARDARGPSSEAKSGLPSPPE